MSSKQNRLFIKGLLCGIATTVLTIVLLLGIYRFFELESAIIFNIEWFTLIAESISAIGAIIAIYFAVRISSKERSQNARIVLFKERYEAYALLDNLLRDGNKRNNLSPEDIQDIQNCIHRMKFLIKEEDYKLLLDIWSKIFNNKTGDISQLGIKSKEESGTTKKYYTIEIPLIHIRKIDEIMDKYLNLRDEGVEKGR